MNESELVKRAQAGDFEAFTLLVNSHKEKLYGFVRRMTSNVDDANDVVQDTLLKAIDKIEQFRGDASFGTWLISIALNQIRGMLAKRKQSDLRPIEEYLPGGSDEHRADGAVQLADWSDPMTELEAAEIRQLVDEGLQSLPLVYREAFVLRYIEEMSVKEVAKNIGQSEAATKSRILRARVALRDYLAKRFEVTDGKQVRRLS